MPRNALAACVLTLLLALAVTIAAFDLAQAQIRLANWQNPQSAQQGVTELVGALQRGDQPYLSSMLTPQLLRQPATGAAGGAQLRALGQVTRVAIIKVYAYPAITFYQARVTHANGTSDWGIGIGKTSGRIETLEFKPHAQKRTVVSRRVTVERPPVSAKKSARRKHARKAKKSKSASRRSYRSREYSKRSAEPSLPSPEFREVSTVIVAPPPPVPTRDERLVEFLFATTRQRNSAVTQVAFNGERAPGITFGAASVRIPEDHKSGRIELPSSWTLWGLGLFGDKSDEKSYFQVRSVSTLSQDEWGAMIRRTGAKTALVFVHGYNTSFEEALYRNAQVMWDLQYKGLSVLFSWASRGETLNYVYDRESAYLARSAFIRVLKLLRENYGVEQVNVLAHSMGNLVVLDALANNAQSASPVHIAELILAAPDVDRDQFVEMVPIVRQVTKGMTLYASSMDRALVASKELAGAVPRAGLVLPPSDPIVLPDLETIDVSAVGAEMLGLNHNVFASNRELISDIHILLTSGKHAPRLPQVRQIPAQPAAAKFWRFVP